MNVPFCDLAALNRFYGWSLKEAYNRVMARGQFILGPEIQKFEEKWAEYCGKRYAVTVGSATDAISLMLRAYGIRRGDEVIVPAHTCVATWMGVSAIGAIPVPVDVDISTFNINPLGIPEAWTEKTKAILAVHLYGRVCDMDSLRMLARHIGVPLLIDAAQAHGVKHDDLGDAAAFSFYPTKNLGAIGDGGAVVTNDQEIAHRVSHYRNLGAVTKDCHTYRASNTRMDELQAAFLLAKLPMLECSNDRRTRNAMIYGLPMASSVWHQCAITTESRDIMRQNLMQSCIQTMVHYPTTPHLQEAYVNLGYSVGAFPNAEAIARTEISLPCGPELSSAQVRYVRDCLDEMKEAA